MIYIKYAVSDLHGCYKEFLQLLNKINFSDKDTMYILGDCVDRGSQQLELLLFIQEHDNLIPLLGNHEQIFLWRHRVGFGEKIWDKSNKYEQQIVNNLNKDNPTWYFGLVEYITTWKKYIIIDNYILCHAGYDIPIQIKQHYAMPVEEKLKHASSNSFTECRANFYKHHGIREYITIFGHTPTTLLRGINKEPYQFDVWYDEKHNNDKVGIDGGVVFDGGQLNCICLDDMSITVIPSRKD